MNDGMLSQEEIDALLNIDTDNSVEKEEESVSLTDVEKDAIGEIGNISFGSSATTLSTLLNEKVKITTPAITIVNPSEMEEVFDFNHVCVKVQYVEGFLGENIFIIKTEDANIISDIMLGGNGRNVTGKLDEIHLSAIQEVMNQMMGTAATSMSTVFNKKIDISPPTIAVKNMGDLQQPDGLGDTEVLVKVCFQLKVGDLIDSNIMQVVPISFAKKMVNELLDKQKNDASDKTLANEVINKSQPAVDKNEKKQTEIPNQAETKIIGRPVNQETPIQQAVFSEFPDVSLNKQEQRNLDMLLDIPLKVTVELGRTKKTVREILHLTTGSIVELDKLAGEPVDVLVNGKPIAKGEVVVIDENFGVRITDILNPTDRLMNLK